MNPPDHPDSQAISAIRTGEIDRYRELIDRYQRHLYAVAWARLGDAALAEEAVQESFIRAYRLLGWLREPARFAGWITAIARGIAINLGIRHRRELRRRERWSLDPTVASARDPAGSIADDADDPVVAPDTLRRALSGLPPRHRECLVTFYLEGRSVAEAASVLGITEGAFKVRLHRARLALRGRLERNLGTALGQLGPRHSLAPGIMSSIGVKAASTDPAGLGSGLLAFLGGGLAKLLPVPFAVLLLPVVGVFVGFATQAWARRAERNNYRDPEDFRRRLYDDQDRRNRTQGALASLAMVLFLASGTWFPAANPWIVGVLAACLAGAAVRFGRQLLLSPRWERGLPVVAWLPLCLVLLLTPIISFPGWATAIGFALPFLISIFRPPERLLRFDYNLFLRQRLGLLPDTEPAPTSTGERRTIPKDVLWSFVRLGGAADLFVDYRRLADGYRLAMRPVASGFRDWFGGRFGADGSTLSLRTDGSIEIRLGTQDRENLERLGIGIGDEPDASRAAVSHAVRSALEAFLDGHPSEALRRLGQTADREIFAVHPARTGFPRLQRLAGILGILAAGWMFVNSWSREGREGERRRLAAQLTPVTLTLEEARSAFGAMGASIPANSRRRWQGLEVALHRGLVLPPLDWVPDAGQAFLRTNALARFHASAELPSANDEPFVASSPLWKAWHFGWLPSPAVADPGSVMDRWRVEIATWDDPKRWQAFGLPEARVSGHSFSVLDTELVRWRLAVLKDLGGLDLLDRDRLVATLRDHQVLPGRPWPAGRKPDLDRSLWNGLFATHGWDPIAETYTTLAILEDLQAVSRINREACVKGILRLHAGRGLFLALPRLQRPFQWKGVRADPGSAVIIPGDARTTFAARESLRILKALDRVEDLGAWEFRVARGSLPVRPGPNDGYSTWSVVEAVLLRERSANPGNARPSDGRGPE